MVQIIQRLKEKLSELSQKSLFKRSSWMLLAQAITISVQVLYFVVLARGLGTSDYGAYVGVAALTAIFGPFATWGSVSILVKYIARDRSLFAIYWGNALLITTVFSLLISSLAALIVPIFLQERVTSLVVFLIFLADLAGLPIVHMSSAAFLALDMSFLTALLRIALAVSKLIAVLLLVSVIPKINVTAWAGLYFLSTMLTALLAVGLAVQWLSWPSFSLKRLVAELQQGFFFSISNSADFVNSNVDKTMLASMSTLEATGLYGASYRFLDLSWYAISAVTDSAYSKFFQHGASGIRGGINFARKLFPFLAMYGGFAGVGLVLFSPLAPVVLGQEFRESTELLKWFAPLPFMIVTQKMLGDILSGSNYQGLRSAVQTFAAGFNILLNLWLIPAFSWRGATWATLASESTKLILLLLVIACIVKKTAHQSQAGTASSSLPKDDLSP
ncbi:MAG: oligosaccharide flippase family protein [Spirulina sp.]